MGGFPKRKRLDFYHLLIKKSIDTSFGCNFMIVSFMGIINLTLSKLGEYFYPSPSAEFFQSKKIFFSVGMKSSFASLLIFQSFRNLHNKSYEYYQEGISKSLSNKGYKLTYYARSRGGRGLLRTYHCSNTMKAIEIAEIGGGSSKVVSYC